VARWKFRSTPLQLLLLEPVKYAACQVENPGTEVTGLDLVKLQIAICRPATVSVSVGNPITPRGHDPWKSACYAEDPDKQFFPSPGKILSAHRGASGHPGIRARRRRLLRMERSVDYDASRDESKRVGQRREATIARLRRRARRIFSNG